RPEMAREAPSGFHRGGFALARSALSALPHTLSAITEMLGGLLGKPPLEGGPSHMALGSLRLPPPLWGRSVRARSARTGRGVLAPQTRTRSEERRVGEGGGGGGVGGVVG